MLLSPRTRPQCVGTITLFFHHGKSAVCPRCLSSSLALHLWLGETTKASSRWAPPLVPTTGLNSVRPSVHHVQASIHLQSNRITLVHGKMLHRYLMPKSQLSPLMKRQPPRDLRTTDLRTRTRTVLNLSSAKPPASLHQPLCHKHRQLLLIVYPAARFAQHLHRHLYVLLRRPCRALCPAVRLAIVRPLTIRPNPYLVSLVKNVATTMKPSKTRLDSESVSRVPFATSSRRILSMTASSNAFRIVTGPMSTKHPAVFLRLRSSLNTVVDMNCL